MPDNPRKPGEPGKAGIKKILPRGSSIQGAEVDKHELELWERIVRARALGNKDEAINLIDSLIAIYAASGRPNFELQVEKVLIEEPDMFSKLIPIYEEQLSFYTKSNSMIEQIETLLSLTAVSLNSDKIAQAKGYLLQAETLLGNIPNNPMSKSSDTKPEAIITKTENLRNRVKQAKDYILSRLEGS